MSPHRWVISYSLSHECKDCRVLKLKWDYGRTVNLIPTIAAVIYHKERHLRNSSQSFNILFNKDMMEETFPYTRWKEEKHRIVEFSQRYVSGSVRKTSSKIHDPPTMWFLFSVLQDATICITQSFYNPYLITYGSLRAGPAKHSARKSWIYFPVTIFVPLGKVFLSSQRLTFCIWKMGIIIATNPSCYEH